MINYNKNVQFYKNIPVTLAELSDEHHEKLQSKKFFIGNPKYKQSIWIPKMYLDRDGTIRENVNIDYIFKLAVLQHKFENTNLTALIPFLFYGDMMVKINVASNIPFSNLINSFSEYIRPIPYQNVDKKIISYTFDSDDGKTIDCLFSYIDYDSEIKTQYYNTFDINTLIK